MSAASSFLAQLPARSRTTTAAAREVLATGVAAGRWALHVGRLGEQLLEVGLPCCSLHWTEALDGVETSAWSAAYPAEVRRAQWLVAQYAPDGVRAVVPLAEVRRRKGG